MLVAAYVGWKAPSEPQEVENGLSGAVTSSENENAARELMQALGGMG